MSVLNANVMRTIPEVPASEGVGPMITVTDSGEDQLSPKHPSRLSVFLQNMDGANGVVLQHVEDPVDLGTTPITFNQGRYLGPGDSMLFNLANGTLLNRTQRLIGVCETGKTAKVRVTITNK